MYIIHRISFHNPNVGIREYPKKHNQNRSGFDSTEGGMCLATGSSVDTENARENRTAESGLNGFPFSAVVTVERERGRVMFFDTVLFISSIKSRPEIWNTKCKGYRNSETKLKAWEEVAEIVYKDWDELSSLQKNERGRELQKKWKNVKDCFIREVRQKKEDSAAKKRPYLYYDHLVFLVPELHDQEAEQPTTPPVIPDTSKVKSCITNLNIEKLISAVQAQPAIWDIGKPCYANREGKFRAWDDVGRAIFPDWPEISREERSQRGHEMQNKWKNLRDTFCKKIKNPLQPKRGHVRRKYLFNDQLRFLLPTVKQSNTEALAERTESHSRNTEAPAERAESHSRNTEAPAERTENQSSADDAYLSVVEPPAFAPLRLCEASNGDVHRKKKKRKLKYLENQHRGEEINSKRHKPALKVNITRSPTKEPSEEMPSSAPSVAADDDYDKLFLLSLLPIFRKLSDTSKISARIELTQVLQRLGQTDCRQSSQPTAVYCQPGFAAVNGQNSSSSRQSTSSSSHVEVVDFKAEEHDVNEASNVLFQITQESPDKNEIKPGGSRSRHGTSEKGPEGNETVMATTPEGNETVIQATSSSSDSSEFYELS